MAAAKEKFRTAETLDSEAAAWCLENTENRNYKTRGNEVTKSDRLLSLLDHVRRFGPVELKQLAREFNVSERTIYRDLRNLANSRHPIKQIQGRGFVLMSQDEQEMLQLNKNDKDLILFCLFNNPLNCSPFLRERILRLTNHFRSQTDSISEFSKQPLFRFQDSLTILNVEHFEIIEKFLFALFNRYKVSLMEFCTFRKTDLLIPVGIRFEETGATLVLFNDSNMKDFLMDIDRLQGISISSQRFARHTHIKMSAIQENAVT